LNKYEIEAIPDGLREAAWEEATVLEATR